MRRTLTVAVLLMLASAMPPTARSAEPRPNIVVIMVDDLAQMDDRVWERMPTLSSMFLTNGVRFTNYLGNDPLCCPGRANFLTGQFAHHNGVTRNNARLLDARETIATELHGAGYWTAIDGKYLNKTEVLTDFTPAGWDKSLIYSGGYIGSTLWINGARVVEPVSTYTTDIVQQRALMFLAHAPASKPAFLLLTPYAVHAQSEASHFMPMPATRSIGDARCAGIDSWSPPSYMEADVADKPAYIQALPTTLYPGGWPLQKVCETMLSVDALVRVVKARMDALSRTNTIYILTDDNGMTFGAHRWPTKEVPYATPMPLFVQWPGHLAPGTRTATIQNVDMAPTLCAIAGCAMGPYPNGHGVDGMSFLPVLMGDAASLNRQWVYVENRPSGNSVRAMDAAIASDPDGTSVNDYHTVPWDGVRTTDANALGPLEYTEYSTGECELYDLVADPWELVNHCNDPLYWVQQEAAAAQLAVFRSN